MQSITCLMPILMPTSRSTLGFFFSASITPPEVEGETLYLHRLSDASAPTFTINSLSLSVNGHFPGEPGLAGVY